IASDPTVRQNAFASSTFPFPQHERWFAARIASEQSRLWVAERFETIGGFIRYDCVGDHAADIDVAVATPARGRGLGGRLLGDTRNRVFGELGVSHVRGTVFADNETSRRAFAGAGFALVDSPEIAGRPCVVYEHAITRGPNV